MGHKIGPLVLGILVAGLGLFFLLGARSIAGEAATSGVGPRAFPTLIGGGLVVLGLSFVIAVRRGMTFPAVAEPARRGVLPWILAGIVGGILIVEPLGFPLAAAWFFVLGTRGFGSRRWARNALLGVVLGVLVYLVFARALGVTLPGGPIDTVWPRG
jgi:putative tricarboxylic transport membrane protein